MSQISIVRWPKSEKFQNASNFTIWGSVIHFMAAQNGGVVKAYIKFGALLFTDNEAQKVKVASDTTCHTLVQAWLIHYVLEMVYYNVWYGLVVLHQLDKLYGSIGVEPAIRMVISLTRVDWPKLISSMGNITNSSMNF